MLLTSGQTFAGYTIIRLLGSGGMGEVYLAQHPRLPRRDALKLLPREWSADEEFRARFAREADLASTLWHPHIVGVHDRGEEDGQLWISMDFVDGLDAARLLADRYPAGTPIDEVARIVTAVASALDYAHKQGLLHRDVKPATPRYSTVRLALRPTLFRTALVGVQVTVAMMAIAVAESLSRSRQVLRPRRS
jgi:serine/threonine-protein kinase